MGVYLHAKFEVSSIILTSFRQGGVGGGVIFAPPPPPPLPQNEPLKSPPRLGLNRLKWYRLFKSLFTTLNNLKAVLHKLH